ncbi:MAG: potassium transporter Kup [Azospirillum sp.]|nr:potassium transporter Kup [Azospirillum sp.]
MPHSVAHAPKAGFFALSLGSLGVVYGDIGTSPIYALRESLAAAGDAAGPVGAVSLILWALIFVVSAKYVVLLLRADNAGEGGTLALLALARRVSGRHAGVWLTTLGALGAALFYGDAAITPAISVLSAVEGLNLVTPAFEPYVLPATAAILIGLFAVQSRGTATVAGWFGPVTFLWFAALAAGGVASILETPAILAAIDPRNALYFAQTSPKTALAILGAAVLAVTGAEALYADLGHFGRGPIRAAWSAVVFPALALNYLGQGALVLRNAEAAANPFFLLYPQWFLIPVVGIATAATIIASQAVITGAYSLTRQAIQLRLLPRMAVRHTSESLEGQIYMPVVNGALLVGVLALVFGFGSSSSLASAYGIAVTGTMIVTVLLAAVVARRAWGWPSWIVACVFIPFLAVDAIFFGANMTKVADGGFVPLLAAVAIVVVMRIWARGTAALAARDREASIPLETLVRSIREKSPLSVPGTAIYLTGNPREAPVALLHTLKHFKALHARVAILSVVTAPVPRVPMAERVAVARLDDRFVSIAVTFGFMEEPDVPRALAEARDANFEFDVMTTSFVLSRRTLTAAERGSLPDWQRRVFMFLSRNAAGATDYFRIPAGRVVEIGAQVAL